MEGEKRRKEKDEEKKEGKKGGQVFLCMQVFLLLK